ncbi:hypothetical protein D3C78_1641360 [compost metagenome]
MQFAFDAQQHMALAAPVIRQIAGGILHHPHPHIAKALGVPAGDAGFPPMLCRRYLGPAGRAKRQVLDFHHNSLCRKNRHSHGAT